MFGALAQPTILREKIYEGGWVLPATARTDVWNIRGPCNIGHNRLKLRVQNLLSNRQCVEAIGRVYKLAFPYGTYAFGLHKCLNSIANYG